LAPVPGDKPRILIGLFAILLMGSIAYEALEIFNAILEGFGIGLTDHGNAKGRFA
jgi:hypothetical protein